MSSTVHACPRADHAGARVIRHGRYGPYGRQRFRCRPADGPAHTFSTCAAAANGTVRPISFRHDAMEIARALLHIGRGATYRQAAIRVGHRRAAARINGQLVANWVAAFTPLVTAGAQPCRWPPVVGVGELVLGRTGRRGDLLVQLATTPGAALVQVRVTEQDGWFGFFDRLAGRPEMVVAESGGGLAEAVRRRWPASPPILVPAGSLTARWDVVAHGDGAGPVAGLRRCRNTLLRRLAGRQAHFTNVEQLGHLLQLMRLDLNGTADLTSYRRGILAAQRATSVARDSRTTVTRIWPG